MSKYILIAVGIACLVILAVFIKARPQRGSYSDQIRQLRTADIKADVHTALLNGDVRFVGVMEDGLSVPGVPSELLPMPENKVRIIPNTSDAIESQEHLRLQGAARAYAEAYNKELLAEGMNR